MNRIVAGFFGGFVVGALAAWLVFGRGNEVEELKQQIADALVSDSLEQARGDSLEQVIAGLAEYADSQTVLRMQAEAAYDALRNRPPRVRVVFDTVQGVVVPIPVIEQAFHDSVVRACDLLRGTCVAELAAKDAVIDSTTALANLWEARADSLRLRVEGFTVPREASRWGFGVCGPATWSAKGTELGVAGGVTYDIFRR